MASWSAWPFSLGGGGEAAGGEKAAASAGPESDADKIVRVLEFTKNLAAGGNSAAASVPAEDGPASVAEDCMEIRRPSVLAAREENEQVEIGLGRTAIQFDNELAPRITQKFGPAWLRVARLRPIEPPELPTYLAGSGVQLCTDPHVLPQAPPGLPSEMAASAAGYMEQVKNWGARERARLAAAKVYNELFEVHQRMQQPDSEVDLVWGLGRATWSSMGKIVDNAIIEVPVEIELDRHDGALLVRPRAYCDATLALTPFEQLGGESARLMNLEKVREAFHEQQSDNEKQDGHPITPSKPQTYEKVLKAAYTHISSTGHFVPDEAAVSPEALKPSERLCVTNTWSIFSRARSSNAIVRDIDGMIEHVRKLQQDQLPLPESALRFIRFGDDSVAAAGASAAAPAASAAASAAAAAQPSVLFPLPYNAAQERIVGLLERPDTVGVVVSGPPGTGKTHTIANIICHCLAKGQRVLVTSKGEQVKMMNYVLKTRNCVL